MGRPRSTEPTGLGSTPRRIGLGPALRGSGAVEVALATTGRGAIVWTAPGPRSVNNPKRTLGRATIAIVGKNGSTGTPRLLDRSTRPHESFCANDGDPNVGAGLGGTLLAWWDCDDDIRDSRVQFARVGAAGELGPREVTDTLSRGPTNAALVDSGAGTVLGVIAENNDT